MSGTRPKRVIRTVPSPAKRRAGDKLSFLEGDLGDQAAFELFVRQDQLPAWITRRASRRSTRLPPVDIPLLTRLYAAHIKEVERRYGEILLAAKVDAVVIHSGSLKIRTEFEDRKSVV